jgi:oligopeptide/dipeptide ABC transporter ATP-binding protein
MNELVLEVKDLKTYFFTKAGVVKAVDGASFVVRRGETLGVVGAAGRIVGGRVLLNGVDLLTKTDREMRQVRGKDISMILQDPMLSLNPVFTIGNQVGEPIRLHQRLDRRSLWQKVIEMLARVKIPSPEIRAREYPHQMSGGMRQRIVGAMMLSCQPQLLIADEPTTALDVTIQAQFLKLFKEIQQQSNLSMIVVTHDFGIVAKVCDRVVVMYAGKVVENAPIRELFNHPRHPYTIALMESLPKMDRTEKRLYSIEGQPPDLRNIPPGCSFLPRCSRAMEICREKVPETREIGDGHTISCWLL